MNYGEFEFAMCIVCELKFLCLWQIPFSMNIRQPREENLEKFYETFHGGNINIQVHLVVLENITASDCL